MTSSPISVLLEHLAHPLREQLLRWSLGIKPSKARPGSTGHPVPHPRLVITQQLLTMLLLVMRVGFVTLAELGSWGGLAQRHRVDTSLPNTNELPLPYP